jgi:hypothetical protein
VQLLLRAVGGGGSDGRGSDGRGGGGGAAAAAELCAARDWLGRTPAQWAHQQRRSGVLALLAPSMNSGGGGGSGSSRAHPSGAPSSFQPAAVRAPASHRLCPADSAVPVIAVGLSCVAPRY